MEYSLFIHSDTFGTTQKALEALRNELAQRLNHVVHVVLVPSEDRHSEGYGIFVVDSTVKEVAVVGDGFRVDNGGEGGKGHRAATALMSIYGIVPITGDDTLNYIQPLDPAERAEIQKKFREGADNCIELASAFPAIELIKKMPMYPDWVYHRT